ncbi:MAG: hypothetical protein IT204_09525 [Fimbriimonadaceae bacterium]|nr:hypothetical protein [Fimbriimonadaceae bacterium]
MAAGLWERLGSVFAAGGGALLLTLVLGVGLVPLFQRLGFVSRERKEGVNQGRADTIPMGGGFILLVGATLLVALLTGTGQIRRGYAACFLIAFWGFGLLGFLDDRSKVLRRGYSDKVKVALQVAVTLAFAASFAWYYRHYVSAWDLEYLTLPFVGKVPLTLGFSLAGFKVDLLLVPFVMVFLFWVSNAVNITDGFNGLAGGIGALVALAYAIVTFLIGAAELGSGVETEVAIRMFALSRMSAIIAGSLAAYLYFNFCRGAIFFGDTGSMALGAALAFLAVFSRTEFLFCVVGGVYFVEALSVLLQRATGAVVQQLTDPLARHAGEPFRPFIIAPLHHHFEHLLMRELEGQPGELAARRGAVRRRLTLRAWALGIGFALIGVTAAYGDYRQWSWLYDWSCVAGVLFALALLGAGALTRLLYDCYFIGPDRADGESLTLYRGLPWRVGKRRLYHVYEPTSIPVSALGFLERRTGLFRVFHSRVIARIAFGLLHYQVARRAADGAGRAHFEAAVGFWSQVPLDRFSSAGCPELLASLAEAYATLGHRAAAVRVLETWCAMREDPAARALIEQHQADALTAAEVAYAGWTADHRCEVARVAALAAHTELGDLLQHRLDHARRVLDKLSRSSDHAAAQTAVAQQVGLLEEAIAVTVDRCRRLAPEELADG